GTGTVAGGGRKRRQSAGQPLPGAPLAAPGGVRRGRKGGVLDRRGGGPGRGPGRPGAPPGLARGRPPLRPAGGGAGPGDGDARGDGGDRGFGPEASPDRAGAAPDRPGAGRFGREVPPA